MRAVPLKPVIIAAILSAIVVIILVFVPNSTSKSTIQSNITGDTGAYSVSGIGTTLYYEALKEERGLVERRLAGDLLPQGPGAGIILAAPYFTFLAARDLNEIKDSSANLLLILPKWQAEANRARPDWIEGASLMDPEIVQNLVFLITENTSLIVRSTRLSLPMRNEIKREPLLTSGGRQLLKMAGLRPIISYPEGILLGELYLKSGARLWILADPDALSNSGILKEDNLRFSLDMTSFWMSNIPRGTITFDEAHLFPSESATSKFLDLDNYLRYPYLLILILTLIATILFLVFGLKRFWPEKEEEEPYHPGHGPLIKNTARLLERAGHQREVYLKYIALMTQKIARTLHAPRKLLANSQELVSWLGPRVPMGMRVKSFNKLYSEAQMAALSTPLSYSRLLYYARQFHQWKKEIEIGPGTSWKNN
ncbi:MAG: hypothetical protein LBE38_07595 [Deltaproteobacteria bacterium]|jgi:hypothetical protein|nr:hypothetical protein [Deltaproteobacteria bacterium]